MRARARRRSHAEQRVARVVEVADRRRQPPGARARRERAQARERELRLHAALRAHQLVPLVHDHGAQVGERLARVVAGEQQREALRRRDERGRQPPALPRAHAGDVSPVRDSSVHGMPRSSQRLPRATRSVSAASARSGVIQRTRSGGAAVAPRSRARLPRRSMWPCSSSHSSSGPHHAASVFPVPVAAWTSPLSPRRYAAHTSRWNVEAASSRVDANHASARLRARSSTRRHRAARAASRCVSASSAGLSVRQRAMRGKRTATPDLCRGERWIPSKRELEHLHRLHLPHRPELLDACAGGSTRRARGSRRR